MGWRFRDQIAPVKFGRKGEKSLRILGVAEYPVMAREILPDDCEKQASS
jgi:hypothetical protein